MDNLLDILDSIMLSEEPDVKSMQLYDVMTLSIKQHRQIQALASIMIASAPLVLKITRETETIKAGNTVIATVIFSGSSCTVTVNRDTILMARAISNNGVQLASTTSGNVISIADATLYDEINLHIL